MKFLAEEFESLSDLQPSVPKHQSPHPVQKSEVIPMKVLFKDEKYISETVDILSQLMVDANITGSPQVGHNINIHRIHIQGIQLVL